MRAEKKLNAALNEAPRRTARRLISCLPYRILNPNLLELWKNWEIERVIICGMMTHMCVDATTRAASDLGFQVIVAEDACATRDLTFGNTTIPADHVHKAFLAALKSYGKVMKSEEILALLAAEMVK